MYQVSERREVPEKPREGFAGIISVQNNNTCTSTVQ